MRTTLFLVALLTIPSVGFTTENKTTDRYPDLNLPFPDLCFVYRGEFTYECEDNISYTDCDNYSTATDNLVFNLTENTVKCEVRQPNKEEAK